MSRRSIWLILGGLSGASAVGAGAFGSHGLPQRVEDRSMMKIWRTGVQYHFIHSLALLACPFVAAPFSHIAGAFFLGGITLFSGGMYTIALTEDRSLGKIGAAGGTLYIGGWLALALAKIPK